MGGGLWIGSSRVSRTQVLFSPFIILSPFTRLLDASSIKLPSCLQHIRAKKKKIIRYSFVQGYLCLFKSMLDNPYSLPTISEESQPLQQYYQQILPSILHSKRFPTGSDPAIDTAVRLFQNTELFEATNPRYFPKSPTPNLSDRYVVPPTSFFVRITLLESGYKRLVLYFFSLRWCEYPKIPNKQRINPNPSKRPKGPFYIHSCPDKRSFFFFIPHQKNNNFSTYSPLHCSTKTSSYI